MKTNTCDIHARKEGLRLITAAEKGDIEAIKSSLKNDVYIHTQDGEGRCALVAACFHMEIKQRKARFQAIYRNKIIDTL